MKWKKEYDLDNEEWGEVGKRIYEMMEMACIPMEIENFLISYILSKTLEGQKRFKSLQSGQGKPIAVEELKRYHDRARKKMEKNK